MARKMTVVFHNEDLYTDLKIEAVKRRIPASDIVAEAVHEWLERREDASILPVIQKNKTEWRKKGGRPWQEVEKEVDCSIRNRGKATRAVNVPD